jgi:hypothetical protein
VVRAALILLLVVGWLATEASGAPAARQRVVLADGDPELRHAMAQALAPWHLEVVIDGVPPADTAMAQERADADTARFVVWRDAGELVVYDRELGFAERRDSQVGVLDPPAAAAAALTIKTMMRLPPPPPPSGDAAGSSLAAAPPDPARALRFEAGLAMRIAVGDTAETSLRFAGAGMLRPWATSGWRFGLAGDGGTSTSVSRAGFKGDWSDWGAFAVVSWTYGREPWELEPRAGVGLRRSSLQGTEMMVSRSEVATLPAASAGLTARGRRAGWTLGVAVNVDVGVGAPTYSKAGAAAEIFQVPGIGGAVGAFVALDL